jgi:hypothetical protein
MEETLRPELAGTFALAPVRDREGTSTCTGCGAPMERSELRFPVSRMVSRVGSPPPPPRVLPTWRCAQCGMQQPRIEW